MKSRALLRVAGFRHEQLVDVEILDAVPRERVCHGVRCVRHTTLLRTIRVLVAGESRPREIATSRIEGMV